MKKLLIAAVGLGIVVVSCGTKESSMSAKNTDSAAVDVRSSVKDSVSPKRMNPDTVKFKSDSAAVVAPAK